MNLRFDRERDGVRERKLDQDTFILPPLFHLFCVGTERFGPVGIHEFFKLARAFAA